MNGYLDVHSHILPLVDDGSGSFEESLSLFRLYKSQGFSGTVVTPHYSRRHSIPDTRERIEKSITELSEKAGDFKLYPGQELYWHEDLPERIREGYGIAINNGIYVLTEFDITVDFETLKRAVRNLGNAGYRPLIAHIERYECIDSLLKAENLINKGAFLQMNYDSLEGGPFNREVKRCRKMVLEGLITVLGTDCHRLDFRPPDTEKPVKWLRSHLPEADVEKLTRINAEHIINSEKPE